MFGSVTVGGRVLIIASPRCRCGSPSPPQLLTDPTFQLDEPLGQAPSRAILFRLVCGQRRVATCCCEILSLRDPFAPHEELRVATVEPAARPVTLDAVPLPVEPVRFLVDRLLIFVPPALASSRCA